jgi:hypothetical protein
MAMISGSLLEVACIYLSRVRSLLRTLAIAEYGYMACSIPSREPSKKGTEARGILVSLVDVFGRLKVRMTVGFGSSVVLALKGQRR